MLECRSNWSVYIDEMALAIALATGRPAVGEAWQPSGEPLTPFEKKYLASGHALHRVVVDLG